MKFFVYYIKSNEDSFFKIKEKAIKAKITYKLNMRIYFLFDVLSKGKSIEIKIKVSNKNKKETIILQEDKTIFALKDKINISNMIYYQNHLLIYLFILI